jgi:hypothetical protein
VRLLVDCLGGMDDPRKAGLAEKNRNSRKLACRRFIFSPPHSPGDCIQAPLYPCPSVPSVVSFPPTAQRPFAAYTFYHVTHQNFYLTTNSTNFHEWGAASPENFIIGFIRVHSCHLTQSLPLFRPSGQPWVALSRIRPDARLWLVSLQPRSACSLLKWEQLTLCALCVL